MRRQLSVPVLVSLLLLIASVASCVAVEIPTVIRGSGTVLMTPEVGPLTMTFSKRDLNIYDGPDAMPISVRDAFGEEVASVTLPDDGEVGKGPHGKELQQQTVTVQVEHPGLYRVMFSGGDFMFGMSANCERYVIESGLVFNDPNTAASVYFPPPEGAFEVAAAPLHHPGVQTVTLHDAEGAQVHAFELEEPVEDVAYSVGEDEGSRDGLWYWRIGKMDVTLTVPGLEYWTFEPASYFDPEGSQLLLAPRKTARSLKPGDGAGYRIVLYPPEGYAGDFDVRVIQPEREGVRFELADPPVQPVDYASDRMIVPVTAVADEGCRPGAEFDARVEVIASDNPLAAGRAWLRARVGPSPVSEPLEMPIVLRRYEHEDRQFGYAPEFEPNEVHFDLANRAWIRHRTEHRHWSAGAQVLEGDGFVLREWTEALQERFPGYERPSSGAGFHGCRWAFDGDGGAWTTMRLTGTGQQFATAIIYTPDRGRTWQTELIDGGLSDVEYFTGHNDPGSVPPI
ncbi:MAG: hypothetical protein ACOCX2_15620, partial [Armatimonadota bacterium]